MTEENKSTFTTSIHNQEEVTRLTERLFEVVQPDTVFSKPKRTGEYTLITASEVVTGLGSGYGFGSYTPPLPEGSLKEDVEIEMEGGTGGGGGGGGMATGRPVAVISVGPDGVTVHPVIDRTKLGIALLSAIGSMFLAINRFNR
ncbi:MAG: hypothetical protein JW757_12005 [Anaerolineales bacterium]|nr:hypothetical protein [Anaerolineales bacterium]